MQLSENAEDKLRQHVSWDLMIQFGNFSPAWICSAGASILGDINYVA